MRAIGGKNTSPELAVRRLLHSLGYRFRLHDRALPGIPDVVFSARRKVIFVHGCFWHHHLGGGCRRGRLPKSNQDYWVPKLTGNAKRDVGNRRALKKAGWQSLVVWECETPKPQRIAAKLTRFLGPVRVTPNP